MLYKVTPSVAPVPEPETDPKKSPKKSKQPRQRRETRVFDSEGREVLITMMCIRCKKIRPLSMYGLRRMADGAIRNQPWCRPCRSNGKRPLATEDAKGESEAS